MYNYKMKNLKLIIKLQEKKLYREKIFINYKNGY